MNSEKLKKEVICSEPTKKKIREKLKGMNEILKSYESYFSKEELTELILSACLSRDIDVEVEKREVYVKVDYIGEIREERYFTPISKLKCSKEDWEKFIKDVFFTNPKRKPI